MPPSDEDSAKRFSLASLMLAILMVAIGLAIPNWATLPAAIMAVVCQFRFDRMGRRRLANLVLVLVLVLVLRNFIDVLLSRLSAV